MNIYTTVPVSPAPTFPQAPFPHLDFVAFTFNEKKLPALKFSVAREVKFHIKNSQIRHKSPNLATLLKFYSLLIQFAYLDFTHCAHFY